MVYRSPVWQRAELAGARFAPMYHRAHTPQSQALTYLEPEERAYPNGGQTRRGLAFYPDGVVRRVYVGIPDTYFTIPAHGIWHGRYVHGWVECDDTLDSQTYGQYVFHVLWKSAAKFCVHEWSAPTRSVGNFYSAKCPKCGCERVEREPWGDAI